MAIVRVIEAVVVTIDGVPTPLKANDPYDSNDPIVREFGWAFESDLEEATARPGERRNTRRS